MNTPALGRAEGAAPAARFFSAILTMRQFLAACRILGLGALALAVLVLGAGSCRPAARPQKAEPRSSRALPAEVMRAVLVPSYEQRTAYSGELQSRRRSMLGFELGGRVQALLVDEGELVREGQPLARLDPRSREALLQQSSAQLAAESAVLKELSRGARSEIRDGARAQVAELVAQLRLAEIQLARRQREKGEGIAAQARVDEGLAKRDALAARLRQARSRLAELENGTRPERLAAQRARVDALSAQQRQLQLDVERCQLRSPFAGRIASRYLDEGRVVRPGEPVFELVESGQLEARIGVPQQRVAQFRVGSEHALRVGSTQCKARIRSLSPIVDPRTRTVTVIFELEAEETLRPGASARLLATRTVASPGFWLPTSALSKGIRGLWSCYVLVPQKDSGAHRIERRELELLHTSGERVFVRGSLRSGELVVRSGIHRFVAGQVAVPRLRQD